MTNIYVTIILCVWFSNKCSSGLNINYIHTNILLNIGNILNHIFRGDWKIEVFCKEIYISLTRTKQQEQKKYVRVFFFFFCAFARSFECFYVCMFICTFVRYIICLFIHGTTGIQLSKIGIEFLMWLHVSQHIFFFFSFCWVSPLNISL